jgi:hypothetical protein
MLAVLYAVCYKLGIVAEFTAKIGTSNPGPLSVPAAIQDAGKTGGSGAPATSAAAKQALSTLGGLRVAGLASLSGYDRTKFGPEWADVNANGCDTRDDMLVRDLTAVTFTAGGGTCVVATGTLADPYTATVIHFVRGQTTSGAVQIDHLVSLGDAWRTGAQELTATQRTALANDPVNLLAVDGPTNESKGDSDAASWLPPNPAERCVYVTAQVRVKKAYDLWVTSAEKAVMNKVLEGC